MLIFAALIIAASAATGALSGGIASAQSSSAPVIVIDAGHGGIDAGVRGVSSGVKESDINLSIANYLKGYFISAGFTAVMTRKTQAGLYGLPTKGFKKRDMQERRNIIENCAADMVISVHQNFNPQSSRRGSQVYFRKDSESGIQLAKCIQQSIDSMAESVRECDALIGDYYMLECTDNPSVIVECGFLSNAEDEALLLDENYRKSFAYAIFMGAVSYFS